MNPVTPTERDVEVRILGGDTTPQEYAEVVIDQFAASLGKRGIEIGDDTLTAARKEAIAALRHHAHAKTDG